MEEFNIENPEENFMSVGEHIEELRTRVINCLYAIFAVFIVCFIDQAFYMEIVLFPHVSAMKSMGLPFKIQVLKYEESFFSHIKVAIIMSLIFTMPYVIYQLWIFVSTGLYEKEKQYFRFIFPFILIFFIIGVSFGYFILIPLGLRFLASYGGNNIQIGFTLSSYISLFFILTFLCGVIFELPLFMLLLVKLNIFSAKLYIVNWKYAVLFAFVFAALFTPPDIVTQLLMAIPIILLYLFGIILCQFFQRFGEIKQFFST